MYALLFPVEIYSFEIFTRASPGGFLVSNKNVGKTLKMGKKKLDLHSKLNIGATSGCSSLPPKSLKKACFKHLNLDFDHLDVSIW